MRLAIRVHTKKGVNKYFKFKNTLNGTKLLHTYSSDPSRGGKELSLKSTFTKPLAPSGVDLGCSSAMVFKFGV